MFEIVSDSAGMPTTLPFNAPKRERGRKMKLKNGLTHLTVLFTILVTTAGDVLVKRGGFNHA